MGYYCSPVPVHPRYALISVITIRNNQDADSNSWTYLHLNLVSAKEEGKKPTHTNLLRVIVVCIDVFILFCLSLIC